VALLGENLVHPGHEFWSDSLQVSTAVKEMESRLQGYKELTRARNRADAMSSELVVRLRDAFVDAFDIRSS
jgi:hypothetical protein